MTLYFERDDVIIIRARSETGFVEYTTEDKKTRLICFDDYQPGLTSRPRWTFAKGLADIQNQYSPYQLLSVCKSRIDEKTVEYVFAPRNV